MGTTYRRDTAVALPHTAPRFSSTDVILMVFVEGVHGVLQRVRSLEHTPVNASVFYACPQSCGADFSGPCGVAQSARIGAGGLLVHGSLPQAGNLRLDATDATVSVPANIAEGFRRRGKADKARYMNMAEASLEESRYYLILANDLGYGDTSSLTTSLEEVSRLLNAYASAILASDS